jgi:hypothetical protein
MWKHSQVIVLVSFSPNFDIYHEYKYAILFLSPPIEILYLSCDKVCKKMLFDLIIKKKITETPLIPQ